MPSTASGDAPIWDNARQRAIGEGELVAALVRARYRLLGEVHDNALHHTVRARLLQAIAAAGLRPAVVLEQFDREHEQALLAAQAGPADAERLATAGELARKSWRWPLHKPLLEAALEAGMPVHAGNLSRSALEQARKGDTGEARWQRRLHQAAWSAQQERALTAEILDAHCGVLPPSAAPRLVTAQRMRDAAMAQALIDAATGDGAVLIAGNGHVRTDRGVPVYLAGPGRDGAVVSVGFIETPAAEPRDAEVMRRLASAHPAFDYVWFTPPASRDDPCAELRAAPRPAAG